MLSASDQYAIFVSTPQGELTRDELVAKIADDVDASRLVPVMLDDADADPHVREQAHDAGDKRRLAGIGPSGHRYDWYSTHGRSLHIVRKALC